MFDKVKACAHITLHKQIWIYVVHKQIWIYVVHKQVWIYVYLGDYPVNDLFQSVNPFDPGVGLLCEVFGFPRGGHYTLRLVPTLLAPAPVGIFLSPCASRQPLINQRAAG